MCIRDRCESTQNYHAVNPVAGGPYLGAYQFWQPTWDGVAQRNGRPDLVGVSPIDASPADQDAMALALWVESGPGPWPRCGKVLPPKP